MPEIEVRFGRDVAPSGFAWMVPLRKDDVPRARIGLMSEDRSAERFRTFSGVLASRAGIDPATIPNPRLKMLPLGPVRRSYADRVLAVGDAAGLVKPTTGGGIYYGLLSGAMAADALDDALIRGRLDARSLRGYEEEWRRRLGQEIRVGLAFRRIAAKLSDQSIDELIELARVDGVKPLIERTASFNWHRRTALALLGHPAVRRIVFRTWVRGASSV
jgi:flavin-dependent dehydrogenase